MSLSKIPLNLFRKKNCMIRVSANVSNMFFERNLGSAQPIFKNVPEKRPDWNKAVIEAEKIVGYTTSFMSLRCLLNDEVANVAMHMRKLIGSNHPLLKTIKGLVFNGKNNMQAWGLIVLLISKAVGPTGEVLVNEDDKIAGVLQTQRALAEVTEMIRTSHLVHKGLLNLEKGTVGDITGDMVFGNKIALLSGDYLLSNSCIELANLQNQELVEVMSSAVRDLSESEFIGPRDSQNNPLPFPPRKYLDGNALQLPDDPLEPLPTGDTLGSAQSEWVLRNTLEAGNLLGKSCQGTLKLAGHSRTIQREAYLFGRNLALAWQACLDRQPFSLDSVGPFSLVSAPVLFTLENDPDMYSEIQKGSNDISKVDYDKIREMVLNGPGIEMTKKLQREHSDRAFEFLEILPQSEAKTAITNILTAIE